MNTGKAALVRTLQDLIGDGLRDVVVFTRDAHEFLYLRDDIQANLEDVAVDRYIDNERYGYVTRSTYEGLHYASYEFTVRGFEQFLQFRTFLGENDGLGLLVSLDRDRTPLEFAGIQENLEAVVSDYGRDALHPTLES